MGANRKSIQTDIIAFTEKGCALGKNILEKLSNQDDFYSPSFASGCGENKVKASIWVDEVFQSSDLMIFIASAGIAVRLLAKHIVSKKSDPAVLVIDDNGINCISLLSGHLGGANEFCLKISDIIGARPIITTATDVNKCFSIDTWARKNNCEVLNIGKIKDVSGKILRDEKVRISSFSPEYEDLFFSNYDKKFIDFVDENPDVFLSYKKNNENNVLKICPKIISVGIGCRRDIPYENVIALFDECIEELNICKEAIYVLATIDIKKEENAIRRFLSHLKCDFVFYTAEELNTALGQYTESDFVRKITGTGSVSERSAVLALKEIYDKEYDDKNIILRKRAREGVTFAFASVFI